MDMKAMFAVVNYTAVILASRELWMWHLCFADGNGPTPNPTFGVGVRSTPFSIKNIQPGACTVRCTHPADFFLRKTESLGLNPPPPKKMAKNFGS